MYPTHDHYEHRVFLRSQGICPSDTQQTSRIGNLKSNGVAAKTLVHLKSDWTKEHQ